MKKIIFCLSVVIFLANITLASPVDVAKAEQVSKAFYRVNNPEKKIPPMKLIYTASTENSGIETFYVFSYEPKGFVLISADDAVQPILGYSFENNFGTENIPANLQWWLDGYSYQIGLVIENNVQASDEILLQWQRYLTNGDIPINNNGAKPVTKLLTTTWNQAEQSCMLWNALCPYDANKNARCVTGCVATAMGQVMRYWSYPAQGIGSHSYTPSNKNLGQQMADFASTTYAWSLMSNKLLCTSTQAEIDAIALLLYHCGVAVEMDYATASAGGSGAIFSSYGYPTVYCAENAMKNTFGYTAVSYLKKSTTDPVWKGYIKDALDAGKPVMYGGAGTAGGHAWVCDGYDASDKFHMNWGWGGLSDGYFPLDSLKPSALGIGGGGGDFNSDQEIIICSIPGVTPPNPPNPPNPPTPPTPGIPLVADFSYTPTNGQIYEGETIEFKNLTSGQPDAYIWTFQNGNPQSSSLKDPIIQFNDVGCYDVSLTAIRFADTATTYVCPQCICVSVDPNGPVVDFTADRIYIAVGEVVNFTNTSLNDQHLNPNGWEWTFEGGIPNTSTKKTPPPVVYHNPGIYYVVLQATRISNGTQITKIKYHYIHVVTPPIAAPKADFAANKTCIQVGDSINFIDMSTGTPLKWKWDFIGGTPATSDQPFPQNIKYEKSGIYKVKLIVSNGFGSDTVQKIDYIYVDVPCPCDTVPTISFHTPTRIFPVGSEIYFANTSSGNPISAKWRFWGGDPEYSYEVSPSVPIRYYSAGIYAVELETTNACGTSHLFKENYIYVYSDYAGSYCDSITSKIYGETNGVPEINTNASYGYVGGHSSEKYKIFATYFDSYTFNEISSIVIPVHAAVAGIPKSYVEFYIWAPNGDKPSDNYLAKKKIYLSNLVAGQDNIIVFDERVKIDGPFYAGFKINYTVDNNSDNISDDMFATFIYKRGSNPETNRMFLRKDENKPWLTANECFGYSAAIQMKMNVCLVSVEDVELGDIAVDVFPNPTNGNITVLFNDMINGKINFNLYDITGRLVNTIQGYDSRTTINMSDFPAGVYFLNIQTEKSIVTKKIILTK